MIDEQFLQTIPQYGIGGFVGKIFKKVKDTVKKVAPIAGAGIGFLLGGSAGAGIGAGIGGLIAGQKPGEALGTAALGYGLGSLAGSFAPIGRYAGRGIPGTSIPGIFSGQDLAVGANVKDPANILQRLISGGGGDATTLSKETKKIANIQNAIKAGDISPELGNQFIELEKLKILTGQDKTPLLGGTLGNVLTAGAAISPIATYMAAKAEQEGFEPDDPNALNPFYYSDPSEFQLANLGTQPFYYDQFQDYFGVPREDLPTDFVRGKSISFGPTVNAAEGGIIRLANGSDQFFPRKTGEINGPGTGTSDDIPAMLSDGEFVFTAKAVRNAGGGSRREGAKRMYQMMKNLEKGGTLSEQSRGVA